MQIDPEREAIVCIGAKEGLAHLMWVLLRSGDTALVPEPTYPIHQFSAVFAGAEVNSVPLTPDTATSSPISRRPTTAPGRGPASSWSASRTTRPATASSSTSSSAWSTFARENDVFVIHDFAYAEIVFDGYRPPSILQVPGAKDVAVEFVSLSKSHSMAGWRVGFAAGNAEAIAGLQRLKSYLDYGVFQPIQIAAIIALNECDDVAAADRPGVPAPPRRRSATGWRGWAGRSRSPRARCSSGRRSPRPYRHLGSLEFSKLLLSEAKVAVSPGIGFGRSATASCASPWWRTTSASVRLCEASSG